MSQNKVSFSTALESCSSMGLHLLNNLDEPLFETITGDVQSLKLQKRTYLWLGAKKTKEKGEGWYFRESECVQTKL